MPIADSPDDTLSEHSRSGAARSEDGLGIVVFGRRDARVRWLREGDSVVIGRVLPADIVLEDKSLSRQHARVTIQDGTALLTDLGSRNGISVRGEGVTVARLRSGDSAQLGGVTLAVQSAHAAPIASFETLLLEARSFTSSSESSRRPLAFILLRCADEHRADICTLLPAKHCAAVYGRNMLAVLLKDTNQDQAGEWVAAVAPRVSLALRAGIAVHPDVASREDVLLACARAALERATARMPVVFASPAHRSDAKEVCADDGEIVAHNERTLHVLALARRAARSELPVLVLGETGTGKEVLAHAIHASSPRAERPFRVVNCGALPPNLMQSALFGHEKGAFTGAAQAHAGLFEQADGGTLLLDEVGELSAEAQVALLRVLETKTLTRLGAERDRQVDVRVLAATHRDLPALCTEGSFREDLMHRLNAVTLALPPLRERSDEIPIFIERFLRGGNLPPDCAHTIAPAALAALCAYHWPGNIRQLKNVIERAAVLALGETIEVDDLPEELRDANDDARAPELLAATLRPSPPESLATDVPFRERMQQHEADLIKRALTESNGNRTRAAELLRMPLRTFMKRLREYGID